MSALCELTEKGIAVKALDGKLKLTGLSSLKPDEREQVLNIATRDKEQLLVILQWGKHAHLVEWFTDNVHLLTVKPYKLCEGEGWSLYYATPAASYRRILDAIKQGPGGEHAQDNTLYGVLSDLYAKFGGGHH